MKGPVALMARLPSGADNRPQAGNGCWGNAVGDYWPLKCLRRQFMCSSPLLLEQATYAL